MESVVRTIYGSHLQSAQLLGIDHEIKEFTTLNEKHGIESGVALPSGTYPRIKYFCVGNGGHQMTMGADNIPLSKIAQHRATDAALFKQLPFVLRTTDNDIIASERAKYALRKEEIIDNIRYIAYYLKRIDMSEVYSQMDYRSVTDGVVTSTPFVPTSSVLSPVPVDINNVGVNILSGDYITSTAMLSVSFTADEIAEYINVANIIHKDENYAIVSEIGLCSGGDKIINVTPSVGANFNFMEAIGVQITSFISAMHIAKYASAGLEKYIDLGCNEPIFNIV